MTTMRNLPWWLPCGSSPVEMNLTDAMKSGFQSFRWNQKSIKRKQDWLTTETKGHWGVNRHLVLINAPLVARSASHYPACSSASLESVLTEGTERKHVMSTLDRLITTRKHGGTLITHSLSFSLNAARLCLLCWYDKVIRHHCHCWREDLRSTSKTSVVVGC